MASKQNIWNDEKYGVKSSPSKNGLQFMGVHFRRDNDTLNHKCHATRIFDCTLLCIPVEPFIDNLND